MATLAKPTLITTDMAFAHRVEAMLTPDQIEITIVSRRGVEILRKLIDDGDAAAAELATWRRLGRSDRINVIRWLVEEELAA